MALAAGALPRKIDEPIAARAACERTAEIGGAVGRHRDRQFKIELGQTVPTRDAVMHRALLVLRPEAHVAAVRTGRFGFAQQPDSDLFSHSAPFNSGSSTPARSHPWTNRGSPGCAPVPRSS